MCWHELELRCAEEHVTGIASMQTRCWNQLRLYVHWQSYRHKKTALGYKAIIP